MSSFLYAQKTRQTRHQYIMTDDETLVDIADRKAWSALSDIDALLFGDTVQTFFSYVQKTRPNDATSLIETAKHLMTSETLAEIARAVGCSVSTVCSRQTTLHRLYVKCFADVQKTEDNSKTTNRMKEDVARHVFQTRGRLEYSRQHTTPDQTRHNVWNTSDVVSYRPYQTTFTDAELLAIASMA